MRFLKNISLAALVMMSFTTIMAQSSDYPLSIGVFGGPVDFYGDIDKHKVFDFGGDDSYFNFGIEADFYANKDFDFGVGLATGTMGHNTKETGEIAGDFTALNFLIKYKLDNGYIFNEGAKVGPYLLAGGGLTDITGDTTKILDDLQGQFSYGLGFNIPLNERFAVDIRNTYNYMSSDAVDLMNEDLNDSYMTLTAGIKMNLGKKQDRDMDGVSDKDDACPDVKGLAALMGCPDSDGDGIADKDDLCPNTAGLATMNGCPDSDGDGVADSKDGCPNEAGTAAMNGCPDSDGDGIADNKDACPQKAGTAEMKGCPDSDGDGVADNVDKCPDVAGTMKTKGCPDADGDGVVDSIDKCPNQAGTAANKGCPAVSKEAKEVFAQALTGVKFESSRDVIKASSYSILNNVVQVMKDNPAYKLFIQGHTDSQGDDAMNMDLSQRRADAVKAYLVNKGVASSRMRTQGFGETVPVADNGNAAGRALNRRVEFKVEF